MGRVPVAEPAPFFDRLPFGSGRSTCEAHPQPQCGADGSASGFTGTSSPEFKASRLIGKSAILRTSRSQARPRTATIGSEAVVPRVSVRGPFLFRSYDRSWDTLVISRGVAECRLRAKADVRTFVLAILRHASKIVDRGRKGGAAVPTQAARAVRRRIAAPTRPKPAIIRLQLAGSGTPATVASMTLACRPIRNSPRKTGSRPRKLLVR